MLIDIFTKILSYKAFEKFYAWLGISDIALVVKHSA